MGKTWKSHCHHTDEHPGISCQSNVWKEEIQWPTVLSPPLPPDVHTLQIAGLCSRGSNFEVASVKECRSCYLPSWSTSWVHLLEIQFNTLSASIWKTENLKKSGRSKEENEYDPLPLASRKPVLTFYGILSCDLVFTYQDDIWLKSWWREGQNGVPLNSWELCLQGWEEKSFSGTTWGSAPVSAYPGAQVLKPRKLEMLFAQGMALQSRATQAQREQRPVFMGKGGRGLGGLESS